MNLLTIAPRNAYNTQKPNKLLATITPPVRNIGKKETRKAQAQKKHLRMKFIFQFRKRKKHPPPKPHQTISMVAHPTPIKRLFVPIKMPHIFSNESIKLFHISMGDLMMLPTYGGFAMFKKLRIMQAIPQLATSDIAVKHTM
jgi:hypothetical protein